MRDDQILLRKQAPILDYFCRWEKLRAGRERRVDEWASKQLDRPGRPEAIRTSSRLRWRPKRSDTAKDNNGPFSLS